MSNAVLIHTLIPPHYPSLYDDKNHQFFLNSCTESIKQYAEDCGYDYKLYTEIHPDWPVSDHHEMCYQYIWWFKELAEQYDFIIKFDTDMYVFESVPLPLDNHEQVVSTNEGEDFMMNPGVMVIPSKVALQIYDYMVENYDPRTAMIFRPRGAMIDYWENVNSDNPQECIYSDQAQLAAFFRDNRHLLNLSLPLEFQQKAGEIKQPCYIFHPCGEGVNPQDKFDLLMKKFEIHG